MTRPIKFCFVSRDARSPRGSSEGLTDRDTVNKHDATKYGNTWVWDCGVVSHHFNNTECNGVLQPMKSKKQEMVGTSQIGELA